MPHGIDPEWLTRAMADCQSEDERSRQAAWNTLADAIWPQVMAIAIHEQRRSWAVQHSWMIAEDAAIQTFIALMSNLHKIEPAKIFGWVRVVVRNHLRTLRAQGFYAHEQMLAPDAAWDAIVQAPHRDQTLELSVISRLRLEIRRLRKEQRQLLYEHFWLERTMTDIADEQGVTRQAVHHRLLKIYARLRHELAQSGYTGDTGATTDAE